jgi:hypothetical protein
LTTTEVINLDIREHTDRDNIPASAPVKKEVIDVDGMEE